MFYKQDVSKKKINQHYAASDSTLYAGLGRGPQEMMISAHSSSIQNRGMSTFNVIVQTGHTVLSVRTNGLYVNQPNRD